MKNKKLLFISLAALSLTFTACSNGGQGGNTPSGGGTFNLESDVKTFLAGRDIQGDISIPLLTLLNKDNVLEYNVYDDYKYEDPYEGTEYEGILGTWYAPSVDIYVSGDVVSNLKAAFTGTTWTVEDITTDPNNPYTECTDANKDIYISFSFSAADAEAQTSDYTFVSISAFVDTLSQIDYEITSWPGDLISKFLASRGVENITVPSMSITSTDVEWCSETTILGLNEGYYPCFSIGFKTQAKVEEYVGILRNITGWTVPSSQSEWGFECVDPEQKYEVDCFYGYDEEAQENIYSLTFYSYADITEDSGSGSGEGGGSETGGDPGELDENTVENPDGSFTTTFDFTNFTNEQVIESFESSNGAISVTCPNDTDATKTKYIDNGVTNPSLRIYWGTTVTFTAKSVYKILSVSFESVDTGSSKTKVPSSSNTTVNGGTFSISNKVVTLTANNGGVNTLSFTVNMTSGHFAINALSVTYK